MYADIVENEERRQRESRSFQLPGRGGSGGKGGKGGKGARPQYPREFNARERSAYVALEAPKELKEVLAKGALARDLDEDAPQTPYRRRQGEIKTTLHWNDRKLLLYEAEFLTAHAPKEGTCVCIHIGASPGNHIPLLSKMFPAVTFVLVDKTQPACKETKRVRIVQATPTTELMQDLHRKFCSRVGGVLVISNTKASRGFDPKDPENDPYTSEDLQKQLDFVAALPSAAGALLKFRLPYNRGTTEFAAGKMKLPVWGGQTSTETRLDASLPIATTHYNHRTFEERMFHFNTVTRLETLPEYHPAHPDQERHVAAVSGVGYDWRYDCASEIAILWRYIERHGGQFFADRLKERQKARRRELRAREEDAAIGKKRKRADSDDSGDERAGGLTPEEQALSDLVGKPNLSTENIAALVSQLSDVISKALDHGRHTLETHPLTHLHEPRTKDNPFNQTLKQDVLKQLGVGQKKAEEEAKKAEVAADADDAENALEFESDDDDATPLAAAPVAVKVARPSAVGNVLSSLGVTLDDEDDSSSEASSEGGGGDERPAAKRRRISENDK